MTNYYIYYRVDAGRLDALRVSIQGLLKTIESKTGIRGRWMRRSDGSPTCMEVYEGVRDEALFEEVLERESSKLGLERKVERFVCA